LHELPFGSVRLAGGWAVTVLEKGRVFLRVFQRASGGAAPDRDDPELVVRARAGDQEAYRLLYERHAPRVLALVWRITGDRHSADDALEDAFVRAFRSLEQFDLERPFAPWIAEIARNAARGLLRRKDDGPVKTAGGSLDDAASTVEPLHVVAQREREEVLLAALVEMPERERQVLTLRYREGKSQPETAQALGCSRRTVAELQKSGLARLGRLVRLRIGKPGKEGAL
jgi:RNA polymerase sigma-70 factor (ECF subfamily)